MIMSIILSILSAIRDYCSNKFAFLALYPQSLIVCVFTPPNLTFSCQIIVATKTRRIVHVSEGLDEKRRVKK